MGIQGYVWIGFIASLQGVPRCLAVGAKIFLPIRVGGFGRFTCILDAKGHGPVGREFYGYLPLLLFLLDYREDLIHARKRPHHQYLAYHPFIGVIQPHKKFYQVILILILHNSFQCTTSAIKHRLIIYWLIHQILQLSKINPNWVLTLQKVNN